MVDDVLGVATSVVYKIFVEEELSLLHLKGFGLCANCWFL